MDRAGSPPPNQVIHIPGNAPPPPAPVRGEVREQVQEWRENLIAQADHIDPPGTPERPPNFLTPASPTTPEKKPNDTN